MSELTSPIQELTKALLAVREKSADANSIALAAIARALSTPGLTNCGETLQIVHILQSKLPVQSQ